MKRVSLWILIGLVGLPLAGCWGGGSDSSSAVAATPQTPAPPGSTGSSPSAAGTDFTAFVHQQLAATSDTAPAVPVNDINFTFNDQDNPAAFDDVLQPGH